MNIFAALYHLFFPRCCAVCGAVLHEEEEGLCLRCNMDLPRTGLHLEKDNRVERLFWGKFPLERATAFFYYRKGNDYAHLLHLLKYEGRRDLGVAMGRLMGEELRTEADFFRDIDLLIPVPLHTAKRRARGYNQSEEIVRGLSEMTGLPIATEGIVRTRATESQTRKSALQRWENVEGVFLLSQPERFAGRHVLLVDDVLTTGATLTACADAFQSVSGVRISILALAVAEV